MDAKKARIQPYTDPQHYQNRTNNQLIQQQIYKIHMNIYCIRSQLIYRQISLHNEVLF